MKLITWFVVAYPISLESFIFFIIRVQLTLIRASIVSTFARTLSFFITSSQFFFLLIKFLAGRSVSKCYGG